MGSFFSKSGIIFSKTKRDCLGRPIKTTTYHRSGSMCTGGIIRRTKYHDREC